MRTSGLSRRTILGMIGSLTAGATFARSLRADTIGQGNADWEPSSWVDPAMPEVTHRMVLANGIRLHIAEQGDGPLILLCHGFPECWYSWRHQIGALAKAGFHVVVPDLRGFGRSEAPEDKGKYTIVDDIGDMVGLVTTLGGGPAVIAGHDIGATIAWQAAVLRPDLFRAVIALSVPFRPRGFGNDGPPTKFMPRTRDAVFYQLFFQSPQAEAGLGRDPRGTFRALFYSLSGDRPQSETSGLAAGMMPLKGAALASPASLPAWISEADIDVYVSEYARTGFGAPLAWYRDIDRSWELLGPVAGEGVAAPALYIAGDQDFVASVNGAYIGKQQALVPKLGPPLILPGCGHWTEQERAPEVTAAMIGFLRSL